MAKGDNTQWVDLPLLVDWTITYPMSGTSAFSYDARNSAANNFLPSWYVESRLVNLIPEKKWDGGHQLRAIELLNAPANDFDKGVTVSVPRGVHWSNTLQLFYEIWNTDLYMRTSVNAYATAVAIADTNTDGPVGFTEGINSAGAYYTYVAARTKSYTVVATPTATQVSDADYPANIITTPVFLDSYIFVAEENTRTIFNSAVGDATTWTATGFIRTEEHGGNIVALARHHDTVVALCENHIEFFRNAGIPAPNSPLQRMAERSLNIGCINRATVAQFEEKIIFAGQDKAGVVGIYILEDFKITRISNSSVNWLLAFMGGRTALDGTKSMGVITSWPVSLTAGNYTTGFMIVMWGRPFYLLNINGGHAVNVSTTHLTSTPCLIYDFENKIWIELMHQFQNASQTSKTVVGGMPVKYGTIMTDPRSLVAVAYRSVMQNSYGGPNDENIMTWGISGDDDADASSATAGIAASLVLKKPVQIKWGATDFGTGALKTQSGVFFSTTLIDDNVFSDNAGTLLDTTWNYFGKPLVGATSINFTQHNLSEGTQSTITTDHGHYFRRPFGTFRRRWHMFEAAYGLRTYRFIIDRVSMRLTIHEEQ